MKNVRLEDFADFLSKEKEVIHLSGVSATSKEDLAQVIELATLFNKTIAIDVRNKTMKIKPKADLKKVFARAKALEKKCLAYKPTPEDMERLSKALRECI